jgi:hypothetical protein
VFDAVVAAVLENAACEIYVEHRDRQSDESGRRPDLLVHKMVGLHVLTPCMQHAGVVSGRNLCSSLIASSL